MKYLRQYLSLLFALVMSLSVFSTAVLASETESTKKIHLSLVSTSAGVTFGQTEVVEGGYGMLSGEVYHNLTGEVRGRGDMTLAATDGTVIMPAGYDYEILIENIVFDCDFGVTVNFGQDTTSWLSWYLVYADGTYSKTYFSEAGGNDHTQIIYNQSKHNHSLKLNVNAEKDVIKVFVREWLEVSDMQDFKDEQKPTNDYIYFYQGFHSNYPFKVSVTQEPKEVGLLEKIDNSLTDGFNSMINGITDVLKTCESGFANMVKGIADLPAKIWEFIENGLKSLFVPSEESMTAYKDKWDQLLESRLGAVYQVTNVLTESWDGVMAADQTNTIDFPDVSISLPGGSSFAFGGYQVQIVPTGFDMLVNGIKIIVGIICSIAFVNGMRKRYDEVMGVEQ